MAFWGPVQIAGSHFSLFSLIIIAHTESFDWFLSGLEWILKLEFFFTNTFDILAEIIMEYHI